MSAENHQDLAQLKIDVKEIKESLDDIKTAVCGCVEIGVPGLVTRVVDIEKWRRNLDLRIASMSGGILVAGFIVKYLIFGK